MTRQDVVDLQSKGARVFVPTIERLVFAHEAVWSYCLSNRNDQHRTSQSDADLLVSPIARMKVARQIGRERFARSKGSFNRVLPLRCGLDVVMGDKSIDPVVA